MWYSGPRARQRGVRLCVKIKEIKEIHLRSLSQHTYDRTGCGEREEGAEDSEIPWKSELGAKAFLPFYSLETQQRQRQT
jgi:hypothetical protein